MFSAKANKLAFYLSWGVLSLLTITLLTLFAITFYTEHNKFENYLKQFEEQVVEQQKKHIQRETDSAAQQAEKAYVNSKAELQKITRNEVKQAIATIEHLYAQFSNMLGHAAMTSLMKETLRPLRFSDGRGYIFIDDFDGNSILLPPKPEYEGQSFFEYDPSQEARIMGKILEVAQSPDESGFLEYQWTIPTQQDHTQLKIAYIEVFKPLGWIIGAGDSLQAFRKKTEEQILERIDRIRFGNDGYIAIVRDDGTLLKSASARQLEGLHYSNMPAVNGAAIKRIADAAKAGESYVDYRWFVPGQSSIQDKTSYIKQLPFNGWILVSGLYDSRISAAMEQRKEQLWDEFKDELIQLGTAFLVFGVLFASVAYLFTKWLLIRFHKYQKVLNNRQKQLQAHTKRLELSERIVKSASEGIIVTDANLKIIHVNDAFTKITGYSKKEIMGETPSKLSSGLHDIDFYRELWDSIAQTGTWEGEIWNRAKNGSTYPQWIRITAYRNDSGELLNYIAIFKDLSEQKEVQARISYLSNYDPLTNLPNKRVMSERLNQVIAHIERNKNKEVALLFIDLDHFKRINDAFGHELGDKILSDIATRIKRSIREVDTLGRVTGDEFIIILEPVENISNIATQLAFRLLEYISQRIDIPETTMNVTASIGIAIAPDDGTTSQELLKNADLALNHAKQLGRNNFQFFTQSLNESAAKRIMIENQINSALKNREFRLLYQPQFKSGSNQLASVEALVRWEQSDGQIISPADFIPIAEKTGQIIEIGDWILKEACSQSAKWSAKGLDLPISVNISPIQILSSQFHDQIIKYLKKYNLNPDRILIEITETALMQNEEVTIEKINQLKSMGLKISLDDFGTGYSSLSLLKKIPVSEIKIDRSFVSGIPYDLDDESICASIISVAKNMDLEVVAEGVETEEQLAVLTKMECDKIQGYYYSPAIAASAIEAIIAKPRDR